MVMVRTNAAAGAERVVNAFLAGRKAREGSRSDYKPGVARYETDGQRLIQWGNLIARKVNGSIEITDAGWRSKTTMMILNYVLRQTAANASIFQKAHTWYLSTPSGTKEWRGSATIKLSEMSVLGNRKGRAAKMRTRRHRAALRKGRFYVSTYEVAQEYGGPEEGGWWYSRGIPTGVYRQFRTREEANDYARRLEAGRKERAHQLQQELKAKGYRGWSKAGEDDIKILVQQHPPRRFPEYRPHYENNGKKTEGTELHLGSSPMIHAPGLIRWIKHGYATERGKRQKWFATLIHMTWKGVPPKIGRAMAAGTYPYTVKGETVIVRIPGRGGRAHCNPLSRGEAAGLIRMGREYLELAKSKPHGSSPRAFWRGAAIGVGRAAEYYGPKSARRAAWKVTDRADKTRAVPNNPLTVSEAAQLMKRARGSSVASRSPSLQGRSFWLGRASGRAAAVSEHGPKKLVRRAMKLETAAYKRASSLPNPISCLKNMHTAKERSRAFRMVDRYYTIGSSAITHGQYERASHAYGAIAAIRRLASMEHPRAEMVERHANFAMKMLRSYKMGRRFGR